MHAKVYIVISMERQILSALRNRLPFLYRTSQRQDMEKNIWTDFNFNTLLFCASLLVDKGCKFSLLSHSGPRMLSFGNKSLNSNTARLVGDL